MLPSYLNARLLLLCLFFAANNLFAQSYLGISFMSPNTQAFTWVGGGGHGGNNSNDISLHLAYRFKENPRSIYHTSKLLAFEPGTVSRLTDNTNTQFIRLPFLFGNSQPFYLHQGDKYPLFDFTSYIGYQAKIPTYTSVGGTRATAYTLHGFAGSIGLGLYSPYGQKLEVAYLFDMDLAAARSKNYNATQSPLLYMGSGFMLRLSSDIKESRRFQREAKAARKKHKK